MGSRAKVPRHRGRSIERDPDSGEVMAFVAGSGTASNTIIVPAGKTTAAGEYTQADLEAFTDGSSIRIVNWRASPAPSGVAMFPPGSKHKDFFGSAPCAGLYETWSPTPSAPIEEAPQEE